MEDFRREVRTELLRELTLEERLKGLTLEERLKGLTREERLGGLTREEIEEYLDKLKGQDRKANQ